jgi:hypothetical protein
MMLVRFAKRKAAWEATTNSDVFIETEFGRGDGIDLKPSVYETEVGQPILIRAYAEHAASFNLNPRRGAVAIDLSGGTTRATPGKSLFDFTRSCHRELIFADETEMRGFLKGIFEDVTARTYRTEKKDVPEFVRARVTAKDPEWIQFCDGCEKKKEWGCIEGGPS